MAAYNRNRWTLARQHGLYWSSIQLVCVTTFILMMGKVEATTHVVLCIAPVALISVLMFFWGTRAAFIVALVANTALVALFVIPAFTSTIAEDFANWLFRGIPLIGLTYLVSFIACAIPTVTIFIAINCLQQLPKKQVEKP